MELTEGTLTEGTNSISLELPVVPRSLELGKMFVLVVTGPWNGLDWKGRRSPSSSNLIALGRGTSHWVRVLQTPSNLAKNISRDGATTTALDDLDTFEVTSPQNVVGVVNQDAILPCRVSSAKPLENVQVQWKKITGGRLEVIHTPGQLGGRQTLKYLGRTSLPRDGFATGNVSLTLKNVQPEDEGTYSCVVTSRDGSAATTTDLKVAGSGEIVFEVLGPKGQGLELACRSEGWFPEPTVQWVTQEEQELSADTTVQQNSSRLFSVLSRVTVTQGQGEEVTCRILNPLMPTEKKTTLRLSSSVFPRQSPWFPSFWTVFTLFLVTMAVGAVRVYRGCRKTAMDTDDDLVESACGTLINELGGRSDPRHVEPINVDETPRPSELFKPFDRGRDTFVHYARRNSSSEFQLSFVRVTSEPVDYYSGMKMSPGGIVCI